MADGKIYKKRLEFSTVGYKLQGFFFGRFSDHSPTQQMMFDISLCQIMTDHNNGKQIRSNKLAQRMLAAESFGTGICCDAEGIAEILRHLGFGPGPRKAALHVLVGDDGPLVLKIPQGKCDASLQVITWSFS